MRLRIDTADPVFAGHYPGFPVLPGLYLLQYVLDAARPIAGTDVRLEAVERCRFLGPVYPGDEIDVATELTELPGDSRRWRCTARVDTGYGRAAELRLTLVPAVAETGGAEGVAEIKRVIPHRGPILLVDRVLLVVPGERLVARKAVTGNEPCYADLPDDAPPGSYAYPPGLLLESWAQAAVLLACWRQPNPDVLAGMVELAGAIRGARLAYPVYPGDVIEHDVRLVRALDDTAIVAGESRVDGRTVCEVGQFVVALRPVGTLRRVAVA